ncbi:hypothetical protein [Micromonospora sp. WMMD812]|uniref:hypothetical protein n=1 Tax=Micromonospora sp. WMMD812 TaxID=3015152 RepID=UPI00248AFA7D|nr:hypothetical protein [Micromonospora sp. WMMD812]WBB68829.1 hypothetical protein O7603_05540 [Micromonospora sp. WMMD812]
MSPHGGAGEGDAVEVIDLEAETTTAVPGTGLRLVVTALTAALLGPAMVVTAWLLAWYRPAITSPGCDQPWSWWQRHDGAFFWLAAGVAGVAGTLCLGLGAARLHRSRRWWLWLLSAVALLLVASLTAVRLGHAAWCPPLP